MGLTSIIWNFRYYIPEKCKR